MENTEHNSKRNGKNCAGKYIRTEMKRDTWLWYAEVQEAVKEKKERKKEKDLNGCEETIAAYTKANKQTKI